MRCFFASYFDCWNILKINSYVTTFPVETTPITCNKQTVTKVINRQYINNIPDNMYNIILHLYINIRNVEERSPFTDRELLNFYENGLDLKKISETAMLDYIDAQFRSKYKEKFGSLSYYKKKLEKKLDK